VCDWGSLFPVLMPMAGEALSAAGDDVTVRRSEQLMTDPDLAPGEPCTPGRSAAVTPTIIAVGGNIITGVNFLPDHVVVLRVTYAADEVSDYLTYRTNSAGDLYAELPTSPSPGALHVSATDHRPDPHGAYGLLWSNTEVLRK